MSPTLPTNATFRSVRVDNETATVDFGKEFTGSLPAGSNAEIMAIYSVTDSLAFNFPRIRRVQFLLEGERINTLGQLDLSTPLPPDFSLEKKP